MKRALVTTLLLLVATHIAAGAQTPSVSDQSDAPLQIGHGVSAPALIYDPQPEYTKEARRAHIQGKVVLSLIVRADGSVSDVKVKESLDKGLDENATAAVKLWRFSPARKNGEPVAVQVHVSVNFSQHGPNDSNISRPAFPDSKIETLSDGQQVLTNAPIGVRPALPAGWSQVNYHEATYSGPASMMLNRRQTLATVEFARQTLDASPNLYQKVFQSGLERAFQNVDTIGEEAINKPDWRGVRLLIVGTRKEIRMRCIADIYTRESQHLVVTACAPDEVFAKYQQDLNTILKSIEFPEFAPGAVDKNR